MKTDLFFELNMYENSLVFLENMYKTELFSCKTRMKTVLFYGKRVQTVLFLLETLMKTRLGFHLGSRT